MGGIKVKQLLEMCQKLVKDGYGDKVVLLSSDDEGNEYHTLYYNFTTNVEDLKAMAEYGMFHDNNNPRDVVILG